MCRKSGLEKTRHCGWLPSVGDAERVIWARRDVAIRTCPRSFITAESTALLEEFEAWKLFGCRDFLQLPARLVDAIFTLESELRSEQNDAD